MANFCTNCGTKLRIADNFCTNCGAKIDKSGIKQTNQLKLSPDSIEKEKAKKELKRVVGGRFNYNKTFSNELVKNDLDIIRDGNAIRQQVEKEIDSGKIKSGGVEFRINQLISEYKIEKEEEKKKLKRIEEIFESAEIKLEISKNNINQTHVTSIKDSLKNKLINKKENMSDEEIKHFIRTELEKASKEIKKARIAKEKEMNSRKIERSSERIEKNEKTYGGYCNWNCRHCYEEFLDSNGGIVGDFDSDGMVDYYCNLGHPLSLGSFCEDYE